MRVLVWQWGRRGAGPRFAVELAQAIARLPGQVGLLSLSAQAELLQGATPPVVDLPVATYRGLPGFVARAAVTPLAVAGLWPRLRRLRPDAAICAMTGPLDLVMATALRLARVPFCVIVHDADSHPGDGLPFQMWLQRRLLRRAGCLVALTRHVADRLAEQRLVPAGGLIVAGHPPFAFGAPAAAAHGGPKRLLMFGRLLPYKGLDLLAEALPRLPLGSDFAMRVVGQGPDSAELAALRALPGVTVENRWVPEDEIAELLAWADAIVLPYREASQSGVAAAALAAGRWVLATEVGGLAEQLRGEKLALLCPPDAASLADAIARLLRLSPAAAAPRDVAAEWRGFAACIVACLPGAAA
jgi:glycosyltransferase involved in cell wall biosynthesis